MVLAHGLLGFAELNLAAPLRVIPALQYWRGIVAALRDRAGVVVLAATVPPAATIEARAARLRDEIDRAVQGEVLRVRRERVDEGDGERVGEGEGKGEGEGEELVGEERHEPEVLVNVIAHSMGGLDARCMIATMAREREAAGAPEEAEAGGDRRRIPWRVASLTTIGTPHRGSAVADRVVARILGRHWDRGATAAPDGGSRHEEDDEAGPRLSRAHALLRRTTGGSASQPGAVEQLTRGYMSGAFNPATPDDAAVRYFSFGAALDRAGPWLLSPFRASHAELARTQGEGDNDGLVSVRSAMWGDYRGTVRGVSHLELIGWENRALGWARRRGWIAGKQK